MLAYVDYFSGFVDYSGRCYCPLSGKGVPLHQEQETPCDVSKIGRHNPQFISYKMNYLLLFMKKRVLGVAVLWLLCIGANAEDVLLIHDYSNDSQRIAVSEVTSIRYDQGQMIIALNNGEEVTVPIQEVKSITFESLSSAIQNLSNKQANVTFRVYDLKGNLLQEGVTDADGKTALSDDLHGIFVVQVGKQGRKIVIEK